MLGGFLALLVVPIALTHPAALLGALPALFWMRYARQKDSGRPEPPGALRRMAVAARVEIGLVAARPAPFRRRMASFGRGMARPVRWPVAPRPGPGRAEPPDGGVPWS
jgi:hypothetical protein